MNTSTNVHSRRSVRALSWVLALVMAFCVVAAPAATASAESESFSAELVFTGEGMELSGKLAVDAAQGLLGLYAAMTAQGEDVLSAALYAGLQGLVLDSALIGGAYGVDMSNLAANLPGSIFAPDSGSAYALEQGVYDQLMTMLTSAPSLDDSTTVPVPQVDTAAIAQAAAVLTAAYSGVLEQLPAYLTMGSSPATVEVKGQPIQVSKLTVSADTEAAVGITQLLLAPLQESQEVQEAFASLIDLSAAASNQEMDVTGAEIVQYLVEQLPQELPQAKQTLEEANFLVTCSVCMDSETGMPVQITFDIQAVKQIALVFTMCPELDFFRFAVEEDGAEAGAIQFESKKDTDSVLLWELSVEENGNTVAAIRFEIKENTDSALVWELAIEEENKDPSGLAFQLDKVNQTFRLVITNEGTESAASGYYTMSDNLFSLTLDKMNDQDFGGIVTLNLRAEDPITLPAYTELTKMSEEAFTELVQTIMANVEGISQMVG